MNYRAPIQSGNAIIDGLFELCVQILLCTADIFGMSYNEINIWVFCIIWPILTIFLIGLVYYQHVKIRRMKIILQRQSLK